MPPLRLIAETFGAELETGFQAIRDELQVPDSFPDDVLQTAEAAAQRGPTLPPGAQGEHVDRTDIALATIDPPSSTDLDQAYAAAETPDGFRVWYAIADVATFVGPGDPIDSEARRRGVTLYSPDNRSSLHPESLNEAAASLLPDTVKPAVLWQIDLDHEGRTQSAHAERAMVQSRAKLSYAKAQELIDAGTDNESLRLLKVIGELRQTLEAERGAISLQLPAQEIYHLGNGDYELAYDTSLPVEGWNAQISLLTGMAAGAIMVDAGHGLLRTLPPLQERTVDEVRRNAKALGIDWPAGTSYADRVRVLNPNVAAEAALLTRAARSFRGARRSTHT
jgi:exoribonuclease R